jgi:BASS family bile acid:Na+ symporter
MMRWKDMLLLTVTFASMGVGVLLPSICAPFQQPMPVVCTTLLIFLNFLSIQISDVYHAVQSSYARIGWFLFYRLVLLPAAVSLCFRTLWPEYGLAALLLSGVSTAASAPFFSILLHANTEFVLVITILSSLLVPFTLPPLVALLFGQSMNLSLASMMRMLALVVFIPAICSEVLKKMSAHTAKRLVAWQFWISLFLFATVNIGVFSQYSGFFFGNPHTLLLSAGAAFVLAGIYFLAGIGVAWNWGLPDQLAAAISLSVPNVILVIVFSSQFFTPLEPTTAAVYFIPLYLMLLPLRAWREYRLKHAPAGG